MADDVKVCPECGLVLEGLDLKGHALTHFPEYLDPAKSGALARKRQQQILAGGVALSVYKAEHKEG